MKAGNAGRPIRVLHLGNATGLYGAERWILALARHLPAGEAHSVVAALDDAGVESPALCEHAQRLGIPTQVFRSRGRLSLGAVTQLRDFVQRNGIDVVHTHGYKTDLVACLALRQPGAIQGHQGIAGVVVTQPVWSPSYFAASCGDAPISILRQYIEQQQAVSA